MSAGPPLLTRPGCRSSFLNWALALILALVLAGEAKSQEAWLVSYGPGAEVWELFGHNALWLRDPATGLDHTFSFGYFEIDRPGFHLDFARGIMLYYGASSPVEREFAFYRSRQRSISVQRLDLSPEQVRRLHLAIHEAIHPHPQYYAYDYFRANCSTWLRDLIDQVVDGALEPALRARPARLNFRDHTRRMTYERAWIHTGIMLLLGRSIDQPISAWEETFLPEALAAALDEVSIGGRPLVSERRVVHDPRVFQAPPGAQGPWRMLLVVGALAAGLILAGARRRDFLGYLPWRLGVLLAGLAGSLILLMWFGSGHADTANNLALLLLNPLWWLLLLDVRRPTAVRSSAMIAVICVLAIGLLSGGLVLAWPGLIQDRPDQLALLLPPLLAILLVALDRLRRARSAQQ